MNKFLQQRLADAAANLNNGLVIDMMHDPEADLVCANIPVEQLLGGRPLISPQNNNIVNLFILGPSVYFYTYVKYCLSSKLSVE